MELNEIENIYHKIKPENINLKSFDTKDSLNDKIWGLKGMNLPVRKRLLQIAGEFIDTLSLGDDSVPTDIVVVGSMAGFNWSKYSDIDLHVMYDFQKLDDNIDLLKKYFTAKKNEWNTQHSELTIYGYEVETYVQDVSEENASDGVYSIIKDRWIKMPTSKNTYINKKLVCYQAAKLINEAERLNLEIKTCDDRDRLIELRDELNLFYKEICQGRKDGLAQDGEGSTGNIVFKVLRRSGHLEMLRNLKFSIFDKINSLR